MSVTQLYRDDVGRGAAPAERRDEFIEEHPGRNRVGDVPRFGTEAVRNRLGEWAYTRRYECVASDGPSQAAGSVRWLRRAERLQQPFDVTEPIEQSSALLVSGV